MNRADRRLNAKRKPACPLCGTRVTHRDLDTYGKFIAHAGCAEQRRTDVQRMRVEELGLTVVDAGTLLTAP